MRKSISESILIQFFSFHYYRNFNKRITTIFRFFSFRFVFRMFQNVQHNMWGMMNFSSDCWLLGPFATHALQAKILDTILFWNSLFRSKAILDLDNTCCPWTLCFKRPITLENFFIYFNLLTDSFKPNFLRAHLNKFNWKIEFSNEQLTSADDHLCSLHEFVKIVIIRFLMANVPYASHQNPQN